MVDRTPKTENVQARYLALGNSMEHRAREVPEYIQHGEFVDMITDIPDIIKDRLNVLYVAGENALDVDNFDIQLAKERTEFRLAFMGKALDQETMDKLKGLEGNTGKRVIAAAHTILAAVQVTLTSGHEAGRLTFNRQVHRGLQANVADNFEPGMRHSNLHARFTKESLAEAMTLIAFSK